MVEINEKLIEIVKCHAILWDLTNPNYKNIKKKAAIWKNIADELGLPNDVCKKKWKGLRDSFSREFNKKPKSGQAAEEPESSWKFRDQMEFIREHMKPRPTTSNITSTESLCNIEDRNDSQGTAPFTPLDNNSFSFAFPSPEEPELDLFNSPEPVSTTTLSISSSNGTAKREKMTMESSFLAAMKSVQDFLEKPREASQVITVAAPPPASVLPDPDEDELFCQSLLKKIKKFPKKLKNQAKLEVLRYLNDIENILPDE